jgi:hypothetical protein
MTPLDLARRPNGSTTVDVCGECRAIWFDTYESLQLAPAGTLALLRSIGDAATAQPRPLPERMPCPRCTTILLATQDMQHTTRFSYFRCRYGHGRFTPFVQFMREKNFVRPLDPAELARLKAAVGTVRCSGCGAPVDTGRSAVCGYCGAPIVAIDPDAVRKALSEIDAVQRPDATRDADRIGDAIIAASRLERELDETRRREQPYAIDLVGAGLAALAAWMRRL